MITAMSTLSVFADDITPHEEGQDVYYEEEYSEDTGYTDYTEQSSESSASSAASSKAESSKPTVVAGTTGESSEERGNVANTAVTNSQTDDTPEYVTFGKMTTKSNDIGGDISMIGFICIALGVVGLICVIVWSVTTRDIKKKSDDDIYKTVGMAQKNDNRQAPRQIQRPENPYNYNDNYSVREPKRRAPLAPEMDDYDIEYRPIQQTRPVQQSRPVQQQSRPVQQQSRPVQQQSRPVQQQSRPVQKNIEDSQKVNHKFDTEEILLEILHKNKD